MSSQQTLNRPAAAPGRPPIEPRLQARRVEVARDAGRRRLRRLLAVVAVGVLAAAAFGLTRSPLLDVDRITVAGNSQLSATEVRAATGIDRGSSMVWVDPGAAARRLEQQPWVADASVTRRWPGTIGISVRERVPVAVIGSGGSALLVDGAGRVLGPAGQKVTLPVVSGPVPRGPRVGETTRRLTAVLAALPPALARDVDAAFIGPQGVTLVLGDGIRVLFADGHRLTAKIDALVTILDRVDRTRVARIDLVVPSAVALTPRRPGGA